MLCGVELSESNLRHRVPGVFQSQGIPDLDPARLREVSGLRWNQQHVAHVEGSPCATPEMGGKQC